MEDLSESLIRSSDTETPIKTATFSNALYCLETLKTYFYEFCVNSWRFNENLMKSWRYSQVDIIFDDRVGDPFGDFGDHFGDIDGHNGEFGTLWILLETCGEIH
ncbi:hypothetical protein TNCV_1253731 [Trichonephila clavipes]|nr:hypothetical protein TNCV_1253731 [Trichonephila clavipes]